MLLVTVPDDYLEFARAAFEHRECRAKAEELLGGHATVATLPPDTPNVTCAHGVRYWALEKQEHPS